MKRQLVRAGNHLPPADPRPKYTGALRLGALAVAAVLAGCAGTAGNAPPALRVEPLLRVSGTDTAAADGYRALGRQYAGEARWQRAADAYRRAAALEPGNAESFNGLGLAEARLLRYPIAVAAFERAVELAPARADLLNNLGYALVLDGRPAQAGSVFNRALQHAPDHAAARANLKFADERVAASQAPRVAAVTEAAPRSEATLPPPPAPAASAMSMLTEPNLPALKSVTASLPLPTAPTTQVATAIAPIGLAQELAGPPFDMLLPAVIAPLYLVRPDTVPMTASARTAETRIVVVNGNGVTGLARRLGRLMATLGLARTRLANLPPYDTALTTVQYRAGFEQQAREIARLLPMAAALSVAATGSNVDVRVVVGHDVTTSQACAELAACRAKVLLAGSGS